MTKAAGYSSKVSLSLEVQGQTIPLSQVGPDDIIARDVQRPISEGCNARLVISVDSRVKTRDVFLPQGVRAGLMRYI